MKYTPGPWKYHAGSGYVETLNRDIVANPKTGGEMVRDKYTTTVANGKLIAAAPEMFEALEKLLNDPECPDHIANYLLPVYLKAKG